MRYAFILIGIVLLSGVSDGEERIGLIHHPLPSPDGEHLALISERRHNETHEYSLIIWTAKRGADFTIGYSLTPRIQNVTISPDRKIIAYLAQDFYYWMGIYFYFPDKGKSFGIEYSDTRSKIEKVQFSKDQQYLRYYAKPSIGWGAGQWIAMSLKDGQYIFSMKDQEKIDWAPIEKPKEIPSFLTQPVPKIREQTQLQWSPDSKSLYVLDETSIWRSDINKPFIYQWTQIVQSPLISRFQLSPNGIDLLYEVSSQNQEERDIWIVSVESESPRQIAKGWSATFSHGGNTIFYGNLGGFYEIYLDGTLRKQLSSATYRP